MKKKIFFTVLITILAINMLILIACGNGATNNNEWGNSFTLQTAYVQAQELGYTGSLQEFLDSIKGENGANGTNGKDGVDGRGIISIIKKSTEGVVDTYEITFTDGTKTTFDIVNGIGCPLGVQGHTLTTNVIAPTCEEKGYTVYSCDCGYTYISDYVEKLEHNYTTVVTEPTCMALGYTTYTCACGDSFKDDYVSTKNHEYKTFEIKESNESLYLYSSCENCDFQNQKNYFNQFDGFLTLTGIDFEKDIDMCGIYSIKGTDYTIYKTITSEELGMPILNVTGDMLSATKENKAKVKVDYYDQEQFLSAYATFKVQGASSAWYPKKNYNAVFYKDDTYDKKDKILLNTEWGKQNKYCLKANWIDFSQSRNVVSGDIYGQIVKSRNIVDEYNSLVNGGAIDGYPVVMFLEGEFHGIYSLNIPKDDWLFDMGDEEKQQAMVMCDDWVDFTQGINEDWSNGWELEYCSTDDESWITTSFNNMVDFIVRNDGQAFKDGIANYVNVERAIDSMLYTMFICAGDNIMKNILWATYDGQVWVPSMYDMDGTWGLICDGTFGYKADKDLLLTDNYMSINLLWGKLKLNYKQEIVDRYNKLREDILTLENITLQFESFINQIPDFVYLADSTKWETVPLTETNNIEQILTFAEQRLQAFDEDLAMYANS